MATATKIKLIEFNETEALNGASLAFSSNGQLSGEISDYVLNFQLNEEATVFTQKYSGQVQKKTYYFDYNGVCSDGDELHNLFIVDAEIIPTQGTVATRGDAETEESIDIDVLQPREYFAMYALQGILAKVENPLTLDDGQVTLISSMAFKIAQSMMSTAADYRAATISEETPPESVDVDINNVTSTTDKILYNMNMNISSLKDSLNDIANRGDRVQKVDISAVSVSSVPTYVENMISEPVSITGTVSVDNFPSSGS